MRSQRARDERGQAVIEMIGIIPIVALIVGAIMQLFLVGYGAVAAESASRLAAREASKGTSFNTAEQMAEDDVIDLLGARTDVSSGNLSESGDEPSVTGGGGGDQVSARTSVKVPFLGIGVKGLNFEITRYAVMPKVED